MRLSELGDGFDRGLARFTLWAARRYRLVLLLGACVFGLSLAYATRLRVRSDFLELLPSKSLTARSFHAAIERKGGSASTLTVVVESPSAEQNQSFVLALEQRLRNLPANQVLSVEHGPGQAREFLQAFRWLFIDLPELERIECELGRERERHSPGFLDLDDECVKREGSKDATAAHAADKPLAGLKEQVRERMRLLDRFPQGFYRTREGDLYALLIRTRARGFGEQSTDALFTRVKREVEALETAGSAAKLRIGYAGDIPNAVAEREALIADLTIVSTAAIVLVLGTIVVFFRSFS
ncbi:MAG TPA: hypothetical protein VGP93_19830, partial [Polyangiaceae bacterium]|nr:hypothetical protein [Polyangiaceae bacterium]